jgi:NTP pyrophosphatase (non-canonical NTP hydrolase)
MDFDQYQQAASVTALYPEVGTGSQLALAYVGLGLGEAGEIQGKIKKIIRDDGGMVTDSTRTALVGELGDLLWYIAAVAWELSVPLGDVAERNVAKLQSRAERGVISGSGDHR